MSSLSENNLMKLEAQHRAGAHVITGCTKSTPIQALLKEAGLLALSDQGDMLHQDSEKGLSETDSVHLSRRPLNGPKDLRVLRSPRSRGERGDTEHKISGAGKTPAFQVQLASSSRDCCQGRWPGQSL